MPANLPPPHGRAIPGASLGETGAERVTGARGRDEVHADRLLAAHASAGAVVLERLQVHVTGYSARHALAHAGPRAEDAVVGLERSVGGDDLLGRFLSHPAVDHRLHDPPARHRAHEHAPVGPIAVIHDVHRGRADTGRSLQHKIHLIPAAVAVISKFILRLNDDSRGGAAKHAAERVAANRRSARLARPGVHVKHQRGTRARNVIHANRHRVRSRPRQNPPQTRPAASDVNHVEGPIRRFVRGAVRDDGRGFPAPSRGVAEPVACVDERGDLLARHRDGDAKGSGGRSWSFAGAGDCLQRRGAPDVADLPGEHRDVDGQPG